MTEPSMTPGTADVAETIGFLRRFAGMMSTGNNATYLQRAAELLETLTARVIAEADEEEVWRYKHASATHQVELLEAECEALKHDVEGHLNARMPELITDVFRALALRNEHGRKEMPQIVEAHL